MEMSWCTATANNVDSASYFQQDAVKSFCSALVVSMSAYVIPVPFLLVGHKRGVHASIDSENKSCTE